MENPINEIREDLPDFFLALKTLWACAFGLFTLICLLVGFVSVLSCIF